jgi:hypothetical protein
LREQRFCVGVNDCHIFLLILSRVNQLALGYASFVPSCSILVCRVGAMNGLDFLGVCVFMGKLVSLQWQAVAALPPHSGNSVLLLRHRQNRVAEAVE